MFPPSSSSSAIRDSSWCLWKLSPSKQIIFKRQNLRFQQHSVQILRINGQRNLRLGIFVALQRNKSSINVLLKGGKTHKFLLIYLYFIYNWVLSLVKNYSVIFVLYKYIYNLGTFLKLSYYWIFLLNIIYM